MIEQIALLIDFGLFILIWLVQLIIYPSFLYIADKHLISWHSKYTGLITFFVLPLMFAQAFFSIYTIWQNSDIFSIVYGIFVVGAWLVTFMSAVPLHNKIAEDHTDILSRERLIVINWYRTVFWSLAFIVSLISTLTK